VSGLSHFGGTATRSIPDARSIVKRRDMVRYSLYE